MINVSQTIKNSCKADKNTHTEYIIINNQTIYIKGKLNATAYKDTTFFGTFNMKVLEFETENTTQFRNREFEYYKVIDGNAFKVGTFITTEVVDNDSKGSIKVTANDYALKFAVPYTSELDYSSGNITLYDVLKECCNQVDVELENKFIDNNSFKVDSNQFVNGELVGDVICAIAGISGNFATITNEDKLRLTFTNGTGNEQTTTIDGSTQINASGFKDIDLLGNTTQDGTPTPDNPVNIETTTGRNTIEVAGKNLIDVSQINDITTQGITITTQNQQIILSGTPTRAWGSTARTKLNIPLKAGKTYHFSANANIDVRMWLYEDLTTGTIANNIGNNDTFTPTKDLYYFSFVYEHLTLGTPYNETITLQVEKGNQATSIEPYIGNSYEVNLGKNLLPNTATTTTINGITFTANVDGTILVSGTASATAYLTYPTFSLNAGTYTLSAGVYVNTLTRIQLVEDISGRPLLASTQNASSQTFTTTATKNVFLQFRVNSGEVINTTFKPQLEKGTQATSYSPYFEPIELCKIGTYQDRLFKASGNNLANDENIKLNYTLGTSGELISNNARTTLFQNEIKPSTTYNSSVSTNYLIGNLFFYDSNKTYLSQQTSSWGTTKTFTTPNNAYYISFATKRSDDGTMTQSDLNALHIQLEEGSSSSSYEPYGNYWYKYNAIGKVVLNGSETWSLFFNTNGVFIHSIASLPCVNSATTINCYSNYYSNAYSRSYIRSHLSDVDNVCATTGTEMIIANKNISSVDDFKTWLSNNNVTIYYVLATPTYTKIENEELIGQLERLKTLHLFDGINNITTNAPYFLTYLDGNIEVLEDYVDLDDKRDTQPITSVSIGTSQVEGQEAILRDESLIAQYGEHWLVINDNPFGYTLEKRQQLVKAIFDKVKGFGYSSFKSEYSYRPYLELGDKIKFKNKNGDLIDSAILRYNFDFDNCTFEAPSITSATIDYELSPDADEKAKRAEIIANQAEASITSITQELQIDENGNSQVIESIKTTQTQNSLDIEAITSYEDIDGVRTLTGVKTSKGFTFNSQGLIIQSNENTYKAIHNEMGDYYYDGDAPLGETTNEGSKFKNMDLYGEFRYGKDDIDDPALFVSMKYEDDGEECFGHFWNGD